MKLPVCGRSKGFCKDTALHPTLLLFIPAVNRYFSQGISICVIVYLNSLLQTFTYMLHAWSNDMNLIRCP